MKKFEEVDFNLIYLCGEVITLSNDADSIEDEENADNPPSIP